MSELIQSWSSKIIHIAAGEAGGNYKTRCGRTIKRAFRVSRSTSPGCTHCARCGGPEDFESVRDAFLRHHEENQRLAEEKHRRRQAQKAQRLVRHRELMGRLQSLLEQAGAEITGVDQRPAGGEMRFSIDGLNFKLHGSIW